MSACINTIKRSAMLNKYVAICLFAFCQLAHAQSNSIESIAANQQGNNTIVKISLKSPIDKTPLNFSTATPSRIAFDFPNTDNLTGKSVFDFHVGELKSLNLVEVAGRTRLVFNLNKPLSYASSIEGNVIVVTIDNSGGAANALNSVGLPVKENKKSTPAKQNIKDIDFRRGVLGEGRVVVDLPSSEVAVDVQQQGKKIIVNIFKVGLPEILRRRLDVADFGSPVQTVTTTSQGENVKIEIEPKGLWEPITYQSENQLVIEVKPIKEEPNKLTQGTQGYKGELITLNFQNIEIRAILQVLAEISGLNIIASDTVTGTVTLRLKDVPWDQALDIIMQSKSLDMRKNGKVVLVAPKDELLNKEKQELEQLSLIAELEPLKTEYFQLNYQKAESFKQVFGVDSGGGDSNKNRILSKRGSAVIDPRTNQLFVTDIASKLEEVRKLIQKTDVASKQVLIEARIVEADDGFSKNLGAKLGFADMRGLRGGDTGYQISGNQRVALTGNYLGVGEQTGQAKVTDQSYIPNTQFVNLPAAGINGLDPGSLAVSLFSSAANRFLNLELSALEADGRGKIVSSPRVVTADQLLAHIEQGTEIPYQVSSSSGATSVQFKKATLSLDVIPQITPDGNIILNVDVHKDSPGTITTQGVQINTKQVRTLVLVENGGTVVLGGIYTQEERDDVTKVPFLGDIPFVGNLFKSTARTNKKTELLVFITPKIVNERLMK